MMQDMTTRPVHDRVEDLLDELAAATSWRLEPIGKHVDSLSGSPFELATVGDDRYLVKHLSRDLDWIMRNLGDGADGRRPWALIAWQDGLLDALPDKIDHLIVGIAYDGSSGHLRQVMRHEPQTLVPPGHDAVPHAQHRRFLDHMAALHAAFWGFVDTYGLLTPVRRYAFADPRFTAREAAAGHSDAVPRLFPQGWESVRQVAPRLAALALTIVADATRLERAMADGPAGVRTRKGREPASTGEDVGSCGPQHSGSSVPLLGQSFGRVESSERRRQPGFRRRPSPDRRCIGPPPVGITVGTSRDHCGFAGGVDLGAPRVRRCVRRLRHGLRQYDQSR